MSYVAVALLLAAAGTGAPTLPEMKQATYSGITQVAGPVTLKDGKWEADRVVVILAPGFRVTGDLDGDGAEEAVVLLAVNSGASGTFDYVAVGKRTATGVRNVAVAPLGDRVQIRSARIAGGKLLFGVLRAGPEDARCCPGELADLGWTLASGTLAASAARVTGRLSLDALAGQEWVLRSWKSNEPAPNQPEVTLTYANGRLAGRSGCNRYTANVTAGSSPGELAVGTVAGTRMACPEPQSAVEARFLTQVAAANQVGFHLGKLALSYRLPDAPPAEMLFDARPSAAAAKK